MPAKILVFAGSARAKSFNKKLARIAARSVETVGGESTFLDLRDYPLPIYDGDLEEAEGLPENAAKLKEIFKQHDGLIIASPEYNGLFSPLLKNTIDWVSRPVEGELPLSAFKGKVAAMVSTSPGGLGGMRGLAHLHTLLTNIGVIILPNQFAIGSAHEAFDDKGELKDEKQHAVVDNIAKALVTFINNQLYAEELAAEAKKNEFETTTYKSS